ncbi:hypothetical protein A3D81_01310 [Candidatus Curtissbacteria bacterium RIFCSPHIGHO2_02_FULL_40_17]|uniref:Methyltransferase domain-containing protein n=3 Tax=Candidatus Curtissiibacteriota TaxID=1752717 RepID=A0A1F5GHV9_9BACT|nr:MAG: hypothetical protein A3D81_01310 [Candidatus Curtissbacteria bacterium RIFCSPHIGHO2_02_FULL_40_17]OGE04075.1 MAG: hypothetical protein A3F45_02995 [Candidatus Curtissbacteria bacterium RIFCSPHIGHO2_12_FULL_41_17]OGE08628.1 MAG: hypothetical protein A3I53_02565 [Candidatus Curtissbacteria bacterium RIFCSPLOWO2_02_FULL_40_13b]
MAKDSIYDFLRSLMLPLAEIDKALPKQGVIVDLGCGEGVIAKYLARRKTRKVIGVDNSQKRLQNSTQTNLTFVLGDIRSYRLKALDAIVISDVLHHLSYKDQKKLLVKIASNLKKGGIFVIKEIDAGEFIRSRLSRIWDFAFYPKDKIYYQHSNNLGNFLRSLGFNLKIARASRVFPGSTTLYICQKL